THDLELAIDFNLAGFPHQSIPDSYLQRLQTHLRFERTLKYVALPRLAIKTTGYGQRTKATMSSNRKGREDMTSIFNWLHKGGVRKILKVTVIDDELPAHKDAAIVECLRRFGVEIWDWKKVDLCSEVIAASTSLVREICLYSSGNQAVLKGWSAAGGFADRAKFPEVSAFMIAQMKKLTEFLRSIENKGQEPTRPVKIAIVDDGLDSSIIDLNHARIMTGNSFWPSSPESANAYFVPSGNHGTQIASLICQLCPRTELYIARLEEQYTQSGHRVINAASAALAVEWATHCGVDIICMSWTIERPGKEMPTDLKDAVKKAKKEGIVMFCAASDQGGSSSLQCYPGAFEKTCIRIGSCSSSDVASAWVHHDLVDFLLPGENILVTNGDGTAQEQQGSSFATAIASGLGGLLIYLGLVLGKSHGSFKLDWNYEHMMRTLFNGSIPIPGVEGQKLVKPESRILDEYTTKLESLLGTKDQRQRCPWTGRFVLHSRWKRSER
ncbi:peptidase S8/S53 domain-containing protein, partial [Fusarium oxysporum f. sp. albedinis]